MSIRRLLTSDLKEGDGDAAKVLSAFNDFLDSQEKAQAVTQKNCVQCVVSSALLPLLVSSPVQNPVGVTIAKATLQDGSAAGVSLFADWRLQNGQIVILDVIGMAAGVTYNLTLLVV